MLGTDEHKPVLASPSASFAFDIQPKQLMPQQQQSDGGLLTTEPLHGMPAQRVEAAGASSTSYEPWQQQQSHAHSAGGAAGRWYEGHAAQNGGPHSTEHTQQQQPYAPYTPTQHLPTAVPYPTSQPSALAAYTGWQNHGQHAPYQPYHLPPIDAPSSQPNGAQYEQPALSTYAQQPYPRNDSYAPYAQQHSYSGSHSATPSDTPPAHLSSNDAYRPPPFNLSLPSIAQSLPPAYGMGSYGQAPIDHSNPAMARYGPPQPHAATTDANAIPGPSTALSLSHQRSITPLAPSAPHLNAADAPNGVDDGFGGSSARQGQGQSSSTRKRKEPKDAATRKYQCTECDQKFARPSALATHIVRCKRRSGFCPGEDPPLETLTLIFSSTTLHFSSSSQTAHAHEGKTVHLRHVQSRVCGHVQPPEALSGQEPRTGAIARVVARQTDRLEQRRWRPAPTKVERLACDAQQRVAVCPARCAPSPRRRPRRRTPRHEPALTDRNIVVVAPPASIHLTTARNLCA
ncbi:hypothetical protein AAT19DRAFT_8907 [Rhodotorula toruloides]|uniref:C2H2-type domain-containing protein n=1 Tax=Rhodotorula toruloides TaxID=5286 RepID=A0A2T0AIL4_RHOTO|nr:hypothetical protein AAT19DRAFT_8907 [Rhodotorula toruloides]